MELNREQSARIAHATWLLASCIQNLNCIEGSGHADGWLEAAKTSVAKAVETIVQIELTPRK